MTADPAQLGNPVKFTENEVRPADENQPGNLGLSLHKNPELGGAILESFWVSGDAMRASEHDGDGPGRPPDRGGPVGGHGHHHDHGHRDPQGTGKRALTLAIVYLAIFPIPHASPIRSRPVSPGRLAVAPISAPQRDALGAGGSVGFVAS